MRTLQEIIKEDLGEHLYTVVHRRESSLDKYLENIEGMVHEGMYHQLADKLREKGELIVHSKELPELGQIESTLKAVIMPPYDMIYLIKWCIREMTIEEIHQIRATKDYNNEK